MSGRRCGTTGGYRDHLEARTPTCADCRRAHAANRASYRRRRYLHRGGFLVPAAGTRRRLQALAAIGWSSREVARRLGVTPQTLRRLYGQTSVLTSTRDRVAALYDELSMTPGSNRTTVTWAVRRGWAPPLAWDDDRIDDPAAKPAHRVRGTGRGMPRNADRDERVLELTRAGLTAAEIAIRLRTTKRYVQRVRARFREDVAS